MLKVRIIIFFIFFGLFSLAFQIGAMYDVSDEEANAFVQEFLSNTNEIDGIGIFLNNISAALPMFVPGFGIIWGLYTGWSTGIGFASLVTMAPALNEIMPLSILYYSPFGFMELMAYSIAMSRSYHIVMVLAKKNNLKKIIKPTILEIGIVIAILIVAGYLEEYMIGLELVV
ncbi:MAG: stage II sporulation protein M [Nitrosopumilus sp.]|uniref:stage II sporulation protein M n=1 Tax=Nitrosopumilus sp. TaxID=2024843 RepID=UPI00247D00B1|nr:stage II sporulation protein M [Nitrosopumilus sp.]MCV0392939.1 stage II sporulation protein M [Nitrosopumilus sp.]